MTTSMSLQSVIIITSVCYRNTYFYQIANLSDPIQIFALHVKCRRLSLSLSTHTGSPSLKSTHRWHCRFDDDDDDDDVEHFLTAEMVSSLLY